MFLQLFQFCEETYASYFRMYMTMNIHTGKLHTRFIFTAVIYLQFTYMECT